MSRRKGRAGHRRGLRLLVLAVVCTALAVVLYGPLAWLAGLGFLAPVALLSGVRRRPRSRRRLPASATAGVLLPTWQARSRAR